MPARLRSKNKRPKQRGDTILSVMISVVIIGSVISTTYYTINSSLRLGRQGQERTHATNVANSQIERIKALLDTGTVAQLFNQPNSPPSPPSYIGPGDDLIFKEADGINKWNSTSPKESGFGHKFCLMVNDTLSNRNSLFLDVLKHPSDPTNEVHDDCKDPKGIGFPAPDAQPRVEITYQEKHASKTGDNNRFEVAVYWTPIGGDIGEVEELKLYYRSHPLIFGP